MYLQEVPGIKAKSSISNYYLHDKLCLICLQTMTHLTQMLQAAEVDIDVRESTFSSTKGIDGLVQPFVSFTFSTFELCQLELVNKLL